MTDALFRQLKQAMVVMKRELQKLIDAVSGNDRRVKGRLRRQLAALQAEYNLLQNRLSESQRLANLEIRGLEVLKQEAENERDDLQLQVWELEQQIKELLNYIESEQTQHRIQALTAPLSEALQTNSVIDLSDLYLGLVGGHPATRQGIVQELATHYRLQNWVEIPPLKEARIRKNKLKRKLNRCNLIVIIADYMSHPLTHAVFGLKAAKAITQEVFLLNCHDKTGVVREILNLVKQQKVEK